MSRFSHVCAAAAIAALLAVPSAAAAQEQLRGDSTPEKPPIILSPHRVIVEWAPGASSTDRRAAREEADVDFERDLGSRRFQLVEPEPGQSPREAIDELVADPAVAHAERDGYLHLDSVPNDPLFGELWGLQNTGLGIAGFSGAVAGADIGVLSAWDRTVGTPGTVVAVLDSGYRFEHPDLADAAWTNPGETPGNGLDDDDNGIADDVHGADFVGADANTPTVDGNPTDDDVVHGGHGVHTAGTIGARGNNGIGITGVAQDVRIMPLRVCSALSQQNDGCAVSAIVAAINYAGANGARVANVSLGEEVNRLAIRDAIAANPQTLFVISAGNESANNGTSPQYPCVYNPLAEGKSAVDNVVCVAATNQADQLAAFSNWGTTTVDLGAPGTETLSTHPSKHFFQEDFEVDDFATKWIAGPGGGFARTNEAPLTSYGITDTPGGPPVEGSIKESTSVPVTIPPGYKECVVGVTRRVTGNRIAWLDIMLDGELAIGFANNTSGRVYARLSSELIAGGEVSIHVEYNATNVLNPAAGVWFDDIDLFCIAGVGDPGGYVFMQGTSMAAPHVAGAAALIFSLKPSASVTEVRQGLLGSVDPIAALAGKTTSGGRLDAGAALDLFDTVPPPTPTLSSTNPASPAKNNQPRLIGSAQRGATIDVYASEDCSGSPVARGTAAQLSGLGITVTVDRATTTELSVRATDFAPHTSPCSAPISYTEDSDIVAPAAPQLTSTDPASPNLSGAPRIVGSAEAGSLVRIYAGPACAGLPLATGSAASLGAPGVSVQVAEGETAVFSATATDASANTSACADAISYMRLRVPVDPGGGDDDPLPPPPPPPPPATCTVPKLAGMTLARAKGALKAASCQLGTVRRPRPRNGKKLPPLVVKSSTPAAGVKPADGTVDLKLGPKPRKAGR